MEFFQETTFTVFLALILTFLAAKVVSFAVSNTSTDGNAIVSSVDERVVAKEAIVDNGLRVKSKKSKKRVKFVDDVVIRRVDLYKGSESIVSSDDVESVGEANVQEKIVDEKSGERVCQESGLIEDSGEKIAKEQCFDVREVHNDDARDKGSAEVKMVIETECDDDKIYGDFSGKEKNLVTSEPTSVIVEEQKNEVVLQNDDVKIDQNVGNSVVGTGENQGSITGDVEEEERKVSDESVDVEDDDWEGIERSELEKVFAEAVNYMEYGGKNKEDDHLAKLSSDVQLQLYGLHKVAVEGPCHEPQPMALKVSARAKWNAWQKLGSMSQEVAMEQYIKVLSDSVPEWTHNYSADDDIQGSPKVETEGKIPVPEYERKLELSATPVSDSSTGHSSVEKGSRFTAGAKLGVC